MAAVTLQELKNRLRVDFADDDLRLTSLLAAATAYVQGAAGSGVPLDTEPGRTVVLEKAAQLYDPDELTQKGEGTRKLMVDEMIQQLRLQVDAAAAEATV